MDYLNITFSFTPLLAVLGSVYLIFKKPRTVKNLNRSMSIAVLAFALCAYFGKNAPSSNSIFWDSFALLTIYCITMLPFLMHLTSAIRQRKKMERQDTEQKK